MNCKLVFLCLLYQKLTKWPHIWKFDSEKVDQDEVFCYKDTLHFFSDWPKYYKYQKLYLQVSRTLNKVLHTTYVFIHDYLNNKSSNYLQVTDHWDLWRVFWCARMVKQWSLKRLTALLHVTTACINRGRRRPLILWVSRAHCANKILSNCDSFIISSVFLQRLFSHGRGACNIVLSLMASICLFYNVEFFIPWWSTTFWKNSL